MGVCRDCLEEYDPGEAGSEAASSVLEWAERQKLLHGMSKESWDLFQECAEDLRA